LLVVVIIFYLIFYAIDYVCRERLIGLKCL